MINTVDKAKELIARMFAKHQINSGMGAAAMAELLVRLAVHEGVARTEFLNTMGELYDSMTGKGGCEDGPEQIPN
jgi:hypothetical protein